MTLRNIFQLIFISILVFACQEEEEPRISGNPDKKDKAPALREIDESAVANIGDELVKYWKLDEITEENYTQNIEDWDSLWHVYYDYRFKSLEEVKLVPVPHFLIPKQEGDSIRVYVTH